ncbi:hypothetical protein CANINC_002580 [Pichia inconspicua]|uniref:Major coat protein L-A virus domain-containing protein n=1 Tax=Pichia inconspicua TaxID=52247 RepID=A0A4T0X0R6_9ASCO|nr:hypothetical protein CANINC_002580 [[Candida] inconspicua]
MFYELKSFTPKYYNREISIVDNHIEYGFTANNNLAVYHDHGYSNFNLNDQQRSNRLSILGNLKGETFHDQGNLDGINKTFIGTDPRKFLTKSYKRVFIDEDYYGYRTYSFASEMGDQIPSKNMVTPLYNLLCLYYLYKHEASLTYDPDKHIFNNGYVSISNEQLFPGYKKVESPAVANVVEFKYLDRQICLYQYDEEDPTNGISSNDIIIYATSDYRIEEITLLRIAFAEWVALTPHMLAHSREACIAPDQKIMIDSHKKLPQQGDAHISHLTIYCLISNLVNDNHLHADFHIAYSMVCQIFMGPSPRTVESAAWLLKPMTVMLPRARFCLGTDPVYLLSGTPYYATPYATKTFSEWMNATSLVILHSIIINESAYIQLAALQRVSKFAEIKISNFTQQSSNYKANTYAGLLSDLCLVAMRYDVEIKFPYKTRAGLKRSQNLTYFENVDVPVSIINTDALKYYDIIVDSRYHPGQQCGLKPYTQEELNKLYREGIEEDTIDDLIELRRLKIAESQKLVLGANSYGLLCVQSLPLIMFPVFTYGVNTAMTFGLDFNTEVNIEFINDYARIHDGEQLSKLFYLANTIGYDVTAYSEYSDRYYYNFIDQTNSLHLYDGRERQNIVSFLIKHEDIVLRDDSRGKMYGGYSRFEPLNFYEGEVKITSSISSKRYYICNGTSEKRSYPLDFDFRADLDEEAGKVDSSECIRLQPIKLNLSQDQSNLIFGSVDDMDDDEDNEYVEEDPGPFITIEDSGNYELNDDIEVSSRDSEFAVSIDSDTHSSIAEFDNEVKEKKLVKHSAQADIEVCLGDVQPKLDLI